MGSRITTVRACLLMVAASWMFSVTAPAMAVQTYRATPLVPLGGTDVFALGINNAGQVVGVSSTSSFPLANSHRAFLYAGGAMKDLGTLGGRDSEAAGINSVGEVVGGSTISGSASYHAFLYSSGAMVDLGALQTLGGPYSYAKAVNARGDIVGISGFVGGALHAFLYSGGTMIDLGTLGGFSSEATAINDAGQITGGAVTVAGNDLRAFLYTDGTMIDLGTLGGLDSLGNAINASGQITGRADIAGEFPTPWHAFLYSAGTMKDLGTLGGQYSEGLGINVNGDVVGVSRTVNGDNRAFLYTNGTMYDLNELVVSGLVGETLREARAISDSGQIIANICTTECKAFLLDPIPPNYQGLWWSAPANSEPYWGINFAHQGDQIFASWYTYNTTGEPWWLSMLADRASPGSNAYSGTIYQDTGPPFSAFVGNGVPVAVGLGTLTFSDATNGTFHYDLNAGTGGNPVAVSQTKTIARYDLSTGPQATCTFDSTADLSLATNYQGLWWAASGTESGWGINFAHQGDSVFLTWYTYDTGGVPLWMSALTSRVGASNVYTGTLLRTSGPRFDSYKASDVVQPIPAVGTATLTFANGNRATFTYTTNGNSGLPAGVNQTKAIARYPFAASGGTVCH